MARAWDRLDPQSGLSLWPTKVRFDRLKMSRQGEATCACLHERSLLSPDRTATAVYHVRRSTDRLCYPLPPDLEPGTRHFVWVLPDTRLWRASTLFAVQTPAIRIPTGQARKIVFPAKFAVILGRQHALSFIMANVPRGFDIACSRCRELSFFFRCKRLEARPVRQRLTPRANLNHTADATNV